MITYFSTFISGLGDVVKKALQKAVPRVEIKELFDGLIVYQTNLPVEKIKQLRFFNNSFVQLSSTRGQLDHLIVQVIQDHSLDNKFNKFLPAKRISFRIMFFQENQLVSIDSNKLKSLEKKLQSNKLFVNHNNPHL